jgi:uncharacterized protein YggU (UPF0235/DUF167 family)
MARILTVKAQPRAKKPGVEDMGPNVFRVRVRSAPERGRANEEVLARLADHLGVPPMRLTLVRGAASTHKIIRLED